MARLLKWGGAIWMFIGLLSLARLLWEKADPGDLFRGVILIVFVFIFPALILYRIGADMPKHQGPRERAPSSLPIARAEVTESQEETEKEREIDADAHQTASHHEKIHVPIRGDHIIKSIVDEIPYVPYELGSICPNCKGQLKRKPERKSTCPLCRNAIYVRSLPYESTKILVRDNDLSKVQAIWDLDASLKREIHTEIVGQEYPNVDGTNQQVLMSRCQTGDDPKLIREPDNEFDKNAVKVCNSEGEQVGYVPREHAILIAPWMDKGFQFSVSVTNVCIYQAKDGPLCSCHIMIEVNDADLRWRGGDLVRVPPNWRRRDILDLKTLPLPWSEEEE